MRNCTILFFVIAFLAAPCYGETTIVSWTFPNNPDNAVADDGIAANTAKSISVSGPSSLVYSQAGATTNSAQASDWTFGDGTKYWMIEFSTVNYSQLSVSSRQWSSSGFLNYGPRDFKLQYRIGAGGTWTDISGSSITVGNNFTSGILNSLSLPSALDDQSSVYLRWIMTSNTGVGGGNIDLLGSSRIDEIVITSALDAPLPVEMKSIGLFAENGSIRLDWETASEKNNAGFEIERAEKTAFGMGDFTMISSYRSNPELGGMGNSSFGRKYSFSDGDSRLRAGKSYRYRVSDVDFDGRRTEHEAGEILLEEASDKACRMLLYSLSGRAGIIISTNEACALKAEIFSLRGEKVLSLCEGREIPSGESRLDIPQQVLAPGFYIARCTVGEVLLSGTLTIY